jgi:hypothetical protein
MVRRANKRVEPTATALSVLRLVFDILFTFDLSAVAVAHPQR